MRAAMGVVVLAVLAVPGPLWAACFSRADVNGDGKSDVSDAILILQYLFGRAGGVSCRDAADVNDDGRLTVSDAVHLLQNRFTRPSPAWARIPGPFACGTDPTPDDLSCDEHAFCGARLGVPVDTGAEGLFFVIDRSESMQNFGELGEAIRMVACAIDALDDQQQFGVVVVDQHHLRYPEDGDPLTATSEVRAAAIDWLESVPGGRGSCIADGFLLALETAGKATVRSRAVIYLGDGTGHCKGQNEQEYLSQTLDLVTEANTEGIPIHAVGIIEVGPLQQAFMEELVSRNGGEYVFVDRRSMHR